MIAPLQRQRGVSLVEALVALAVMAFGLLGIVGVQMTLRLNSDIAKQRAEAVRIAQEAVETWRAFTVLPATAGVTAYADVQTMAPTAVTGLGTNTTFMLNHSVVDAVAPALKTLVTEVSWLDRSGQTQKVSFGTVIAGITPELAGSLGLPARSLSSGQVRGRHGGIPVTATDLGNGTSSFAPPGGGTLTWVFSNTTGAIISLCNPAPGCTPSNALLLAGFVRFATGGTQPTPVDAEAPLSTAIPVEVLVNLTLPSTSTVECFEDISGGIYISYFCAVPVTSSVPPQWSGRSILAGGLPLASTLADNTAGNYKVCRYTPEPTDTPSQGNIDHPLDYSLVRAPLTNQNFLVIRAGSGIGTGFSCPGDDTSTPLVNGRTRAHQPLS